jgi:hypothetical protein
VQRAHPTKIQLPRQRRFKVFPLRLQAKLKLVAVAQTKEQLRFQRPSNYKNNAKTIASTPIEITATHFVCYKQKLLPSLKQSNNYRFNAHRITAKHSFAANKTTTRHLRSQTKAQN